MLMTKLTFKRSNNDDLYWVLHMLEATGVQRMIGLNMIQDTIELFIDAYNI